jgi:type IV pilus assembly protein PilY1
MKRKPLTRLSALMLCGGLLGAPLFSRADDIDIFTGASAGTKANPRILIVLDNTSNWARQNQQWPSGATQGESEAHAIQLLLDGVTDGISLGLMEFVVGGNANNNGGFVRSHVLPMNTTNKAYLSGELTKIMNGINSPSEKRNSNTEYGNLMWDAYNYFSGLTSHDPTAHTSTAHSAGYTTPWTTFKSPLTADNLCGNTYIIFIGNPSSSGPANDDAANTAALAEINGVKNASGNFVPVPQLGLPNFTNTSVTSKVTVGTTPGCYSTANAAAAALLVAPFPARCASYTEGCAVTTSLPAAASACAAGTFQWNVEGTDIEITNVPSITTTPDTGPRNADEWAQVMFRRGVAMAGSTARPSVSTYTIDVYNKQPNAEHTKLLLSMAQNGNGRYFAAKNEQSILDALKTIMAEILAVNSTFASTSLPVNATNRSQNKNEVFIGMFRPDKWSKPRWFGNMKRYQLIAAGAAVELGDVNKLSAVNKQTGFVTPCAQSWWTTDSGGYWQGLGIDPDPKGTCTASSYDAYSDAPDGSFVEKGGAAEVLRLGNVGGVSTSKDVVRTVYTVKSNALAAFNTANTGLSADLVNYMLGQDVNNERKSNTLSKTRPSIHGDVVHSRPLPINYGDAASQGVTVYYGANDGTLRAMNATTGVERWALIAPEFHTRLERIMDNAPLVAYPDDTGKLPVDGATRKDYFFDGNIGVYQNATIGAGSKTWIYPTMRRGGRMIYALDVTDPAAPEFKWSRGCPNLDNDTGCSTDADADKTAAWAGIGQTWSSPNVAFIKGYSTTNPVIVIGGGYDKCEDEDSKTPACAGKKGGYIYLIDAFTGALIRSFTTDRAVAADVSLVDLDNDAMADYAYAADTGGNIYRVDFIANPSTKTALASSLWARRKVAYTTGAGRKFLFAPAVLSNGDKVYVALGSGDREHPLQVQYPYSVLNRFYVYKDDLSAGALTLPYDLDSLENYSGKNSCDTPQVTPRSALRGWFMNLDENGPGEQTVTTALIVSGLVTFSTNRPFPPDAGSCTTSLGEARGYWVNLFNGAGAIGVDGTCGGDRSVPFVGGGLPPSPVLGVNVRIGDEERYETVVLGAGQRVKGATSTPIGAQVAPAPINAKRKRAYSYTKGD